MSPPPESSPLTASVHHLRVQRTARYYLLGGASGAPRTIWFVLHGYGQLAGTFVQFFRDLANSDTLVVAPEALSRFYLVSPDKAPARDRPVGASWMTRDDRDSDIADYVEQLDALYDDVASEAAKQGARVNVLGFSQGAATATRWITHGKAAVHRLVLWGGLVPPDTDLSHGQRSLRDLPLTIVAGRGDQYVTEDALAAEQRRLDEARVHYTLIQFDGGHVISRAIFPQLADGAISAASGR